MTIETLRRQGKVCIVCMTCNYSDVKCQEKTGNQIVKLVGIETFCYTFYQYWQKIRRYSKTCIKMSKLSPKEIVIRK